ncbi:MAG: alpha/beta fold hydrolase [Candidatus Thiodiazotropha sp.]
MINSAIPLYCREFGDPDAPKLCLLHGLFGSANNWLGVVKYLQDSFHIIAPDLRNHGRSPHHKAMDYGSMAEDLLQLINQLEIDGLHLLGHSMGGKVAMLLALQQPERVERLVVADIAPVAYAHRFDNIFRGLAGMPLDEIKSREEADRWLAEWVGESGVRQYLLQNLLKQSSGWRWRFNLEVLRDAIADLVDFPEVKREIFAGEALFIHGEKSDYVKDAYRDRIAQLFPHYRLRMLHGAGHWLYAEQPRLFAQAVKSFVTG